MNQEALSVGQKRIVRALADRLYHSDNPDRVPCGEIEIDRQYSQFLADMQPMLLFGIKALLIAFQWLPLFFIGKLSRFTMLSPGDQDRYIGKWENHRIYPLKMAFTSIRLTLSLVFFDDDRMLDEVGWDVHCTGEES